MVVEADESDGTFTRLPATIAVVTNIDPEHLDFYGSFDALRQAFEDFVGNIPFYGFAALCIDHPVVQGMIPKLSDRRVLTYGFSPQADIRAVDVRLGRDGARYDIVVSDALAERGRTIAGPVPADVRPAQRAEFAGRGGGRRGDGARRRGAARGAAQFQGREAPLYQDRRVERRHRHRRLRPSPGRDRGGAEGGARDRRGQGDRRRAAAPLHAALAHLFDGFCTCFNDADIVLVADIYAAGEAPIEGVSRDALVAGLDRARPSQCPAAGRPERAGAA